MISIASAMQQDAIKELLEGYNEALGNSPLFSVNSCLRKWFKKIGWLI